MPAITAPSSARRVLSEDLRQRFMQRRNRVLARASRMHLLLLGGGVLAFWGWDWWLDPAGAMQTWPYRAVLALLCCSAIGWIRRVPEALLPMAYAGILGSCMIGVGVGLTELHEGLQYGTAGIVVFLAILAFYSIPPTLYLQTSGAVLVLLLPLLHWRGVDPRELFNYATYHALFTWIGATAALMLMRQQLKVFLLEQRHAEDARTDPLTGLYNRRLVYELGPRQMDLARRQDLPLVAMLVDIDHFKRVNDQYGHDIGDRALQAVAACMRDTLRGSDTIGRVGGEEFVAILLDATLDDARRAGERLLGAVRAIRIDSQPALRLSVSLGLAAMDAQVNAWDPLLKAADDALLAAKSQGRDRLVLADAA
ncbi:MAG: diguanylate cyclase [Xanthomonadales bacterium]|jgi:diguanylate cyclase (GGDEF)-like protein|nr:diguanylate cyclase [Xanthomonadales bacterium]